MGAKPAQLMAPHDLRLRLVAAFIAVACISQLHSLALAVPVLAVVALALLLERVQPQLWKRLLHVEGFLLLLFATLPFTVPGEPVFHIGPLAASSEGIWRAALIACKVSATVMLLIALLSDVEPSRLGPALHGLRVPERLNKLLVMTVRYASLLRDELHRQHDAMRARGFRPRSNRHTWRSYGNLAGMLLVRAFDRAQRVEEAMLCRGYAGRFPYQVQPAPGQGDWSRFAAITGFGILALAADRL